MDKTNIIIIDDNLQDDDPLIVELGIIYQDIKLFQHSQKGVNFILENLTKRMIVVLDINLGTGEINGHEVLNLVRQQTKLIPIIIWSAKDSFNVQDMSDFINNNAMFFVSQTSSSKEILTRISEANKLLKLDVATAIEEWLELQGNKEQSMIAHGNGNTYSVSDLINEIRQQTDVGQEIQENMLKLTIDLLFRNKEQV